MLVPSLGGAVCLEPLLFLNILSDTLDVGVGFGSGSVHHLHHPVGLKEEEVSTGEVIPHSELAGDEAVVNAGELGLELIEGRLAGLIGSVLGCG